MRRRRFSPKLNCNSVEQTKVFTKIANLLIRMIKGEENEELWNQLKIYFQNYSKEASLKKKFKRFGNKINSGHFENSRLYGGSAGFRKDLISAINRAIKESML